MWCPLETSEATTVYSFTKQYVVPLQVPLAPSGAPKPRPMEELRSIAKAEALPGWQLLPMLEVFHEPRSTELAGLHFCGQGRAARAKGSG